MRDLSSIYTGKEIKTLPLRFRDFAAWQNDFIGSDKIKTMEQYWLSRFYGDLPSLNIITDKPRGSVASYKGHTLPFELDSALKHKLIKLADKTGTTLFMLLLSAWKILLAKYSNQDDIVVGIPASGRPTNELDDVVGMFVNTLAIRSHPKPKMVYEDYLATLKEDLLGAFDNQTFQFDALVEKLGIKRTPGRSPLFDVMFSYENFINHNYDFGELSSSGMDVDCDIAKFDLTLSIADTDQGFDCCLEYRSALFEANTIRRMGKHYRRLLENIVTNENANIADLSLMSKEEAERSLFQFNIEKPSINLDCTLHGLIEQAALIDPEHIALVDGKIRLSYAQLNRRANQLAYTLRKKGVGPDDMVGLWAKRHHTTIVAMLAIMKAGGAYLPIDPKSPNERDRKSVV